MRDELLQHRNVTIKRHVETDATARAMGTKHQAECEHNATLSTTERMTAMLDLMAQATKEGKGVKIDKAMRLQLARHSKCVKRTVCPKKCG